MSSQHRRRRAKQRKSIPSRRRSDELIRINRRRATILSIESLEERRLLAADFDLLSGSRVDRVIDAAGDVDRFDFVVAAPTKVCFDSFTNDSQLNWSLTGPAGTLVDQRDFADSDNWSISDSAIDLAPGSYEITVAGYGDHTGAYGFRLIDLSAAVEITPGVQVDGTLDPATESDAYRFARRRATSSFSTPSPPARKTRRGDCSIPTGTTYSRRLSPTTSVRKSCPPTATTRCSSKATSLMPARPPTASTCNRKGTT